MANKKGARQDALPGLENRKIKALQDAAMDYADIRDQRVALTSQEVELKQKLIDLMHKHDRETYTYNGVTITLVHEEESVKVKVSKPKAEESEEEEAEAVGA
jgi:hypothetical protein